MSDLYAVIRRERDLRLREVERQRALGLTEPGRPLHWFRANDQWRVGKPIASLTYGRRGDTGPRPVSR
jgi:hypothetical protein